MPATENEIPLGGNFERLTLGFDFSLSRSISGAARSILRTAKVTRLYDTALSLFYCFLTKIAGVFWSSAWHHLPNPT